MACTIVACRSASSDGCTIFLRLSKTLSQHSARGFAVVSLGARPCALLSCLPSSAAMLRRYSCRSGRQLVREPTQR